MPDEVQSFKFDLTCGRCGHVLRLPITAVGKQTLCPKCGLVLSVTHPGRADDDANQRAGLQLPPRVGHVKYLESLEQSASNRPIRARRSASLGRLAWALIILNVIVLAIIVAGVIIWWLGD